jgi:tRNA(Ile2) C34 agmatinyltransferase TiaS
MPQVQPYPPVCPRCQKGMKLMLAEGARQKVFRCGDCGQPDPMQSDETQAWLKGELGTAR